MATGNLQYIGNFTGLVSGTHGVNVTITCTAVLPDAVNLASGFNTVSIPSGFNGCVWCPPSANTQTMTFKGVTGDTGRALHKTRQEVFWFDTGVTDFGITAGGTITGVEVIWLAS